MACVEAATQPPRRRNLRPTGFFMRCYNAVMSEPQPNRFNKGDPVRINDGPFKGFVGVVDKANEPKGYAIVFIQIPGVSDPTPVQLEQRQLDRV
jgi:transcription antitermination factor NusG